MVLGAVTYFVVASLDLPDKSVEREVMLLTVVGWNTMLLIVTVLVIIDSIRKIRVRKTRELATGVFVASSAKQQSC